MASTMIHVAVASELNKKLKRNPRDLFVGTIAPDVAKLVGLDKSVTHFSTPEDDNMPHLNEFLVKYLNNFDDDFVLGYYIHLYVDYLWFKYFMSELVHDDESYVLDIHGNKIYYDDEYEMFHKYIYDDYTNLNVQLVDEYNIDLTPFYDATLDFDKIVSECPMDKLDVLIKNMSNIIMKSKEKKPFSFNIKNVKKFIETSLEIIENDLKELGVNI